jgi:hypothetical protein
VCGHARGLTRSGRRNSVFFYGVSPSNPIAFEAAARVRQRHASFYARIRPLKREVIRAKRSQRSRLRYPPSHCYGATRGYGAASRGRRPEVRDHRIRVISVTCSAVASAKADPRLRKRGSRPVVVWYENIGMAVIRATFSLGPESVKKLKRLAQNHSE